MNNSVEMHNASKGAIEPTLIVVKEEAIDDDDDSCALEEIRINEILAKQARPEVGCVVKIDAIELLPREAAKNMKGDYGYGVTSGIEDQCEVTTTRACQIHWSIEHLDKGDSFFEFDQPVCEHDFEVVKYPDGKDEGEDEEMSKQIKKRMEAGELFSMQMLSASFVPLTIATGSNIVKN